MSIVIITCHLSNLSFHVVFSEFVEICVVDFCSPFAFAALLTDSVSWRSCWSRLSWCTHIGLIMLILSEFSL